MVMGAIKDENTDTWYASFHYRNHKGDRLHKTKRGFKTEAEAQLFEKDFLRAYSESMDMTFEAFVAHYLEDLTPRIRESTMGTKRHIIETKILPFFAKLRMDQIKPRDILRWQNELMDGFEANGYSPTYLRTINSQLSAIFNHAVRFYGMARSPMTSLSPIGDKNASEMLFWTKDEYLAFSRETMSKPQGFHAFELLYWCGIRLGEMLALTPADFDFEKNILTINKSYQRIKGRDVITPPKTKKSVRKIVMPAFLSEEMQDYIQSICLEENDRIFLFSKSFLHHEIRRCCELTGIKQIRVHDLRHSHVSLLINMGYSALSIADRMGHESVDITYRYAHLFPNVQSNMADSLNAMRGDI